MDKEELLFMTSCSGGYLENHRFFILVPLLYNACEHLLNAGNTDGLNGVDTKYIWFPS